MRNHGLATFILGLPLLITVFRIETTGELEPDSLAIDYCDECSLHEWAETILELRDFFDKRVNALHLSCFLFSGELF
jgi:hypothetical protein